MIFNFCCAEYLRPSFLNPSSTMMAAAMTSRIVSTSRALNSARPSPVYKTAVGILPIAIANIKFKKETPPKAAAALTNGEGKME